MSPQCSRRASARDNGVCGLTPWTMVIPSLHWQSPWIRAAASARSFGWTHRECRCGVTPARRPSAAPRNLWCIDGTEYPGLVTHARASQLTRAFDSCCIATHSCCCDVPDTSPVRAPRRCLTSSQAPTGPSWALSASFRAARSSSCCTTWRCAAVTAGDPVAAVAAPTSARGA